MILDTIAALCWLSLGLFILITNSVDRFNYGITWGVLMVYMIIDIFMEGL